MIKTCKKIIHSKYTGDPAAGNDIAILVLQKEAEHHTPIDGIISLADCQNASSRLSSFGWFSAGKNGSPSDQLQVVMSVQPVENKECSAVLQGVPSRGVVCAETEFRAVPECE